MKFEQLRKKVLKDSAVITIVAGVLGAAVYGLDMMDDDYTQQGEATKKEVDAIDVEMNSLKGKYQNITDNKEMYHEILDKQLRGELSIQRQALEDKFHEFKDKYKLDDSLTINMTAPEDITDPKYKRKTSSVNYRDVTVTFNTLSDENIYDLINALQSQLPGVSRIVTLNMIKNSPLTDAVIETISQTGAFALVKAEIKFTWYGINSIDSPDKNDKNANAAKK